MYIFQFFWDSKECCGVRVGEGIFFYDEGRLFGVEIADGVGVKKIADVRVRFDKSPNTEVWDDKEFLPKIWID